MKNLFVKLLSFVLVIVSLLALTACGDNGGGGGSSSYDYKRTGAEYLAEKATCTTPAKYYFSDKAGEKSTKTFEMGKPAHDYIDNVCKDCQAKEVYTEGLRFTIKDDYAICNGFAQGAEVVENVIIPQKYNNKPVTMIGSYAFKDSKIKSIILPYYLETISLDAFRNCTAIGTITITSNVKEINGTAFTGCSVLEQAIFENPNNWYRNKFPKKPDIDECTSPADMQDKKEMAKTLKKSDGSYSFFRAY